MPRIYKLRGPIAHRYTNAGHPKTEYLLLTERGEPCRLYGEPTYVAGVEAAERAIRNLPKGERPEVFRVEME